MLAFAQHRVIEAASGAVPREPPDGCDRLSYRVTPRRQRSLRAPRTAETRLVSRRQRRLLALLRAPRGQRAALVGCPELVQTANSLAVNDDLGKARESSHLSKLSLQFWVLCQVDLFEHYAALREERLRADAESARVSREKGHATRHVNEYTSLLPSQIPAETGFV